MALTQQQVEQTFGKFSWHDDPDRKGMIVIAGDWILHNLARLSPPFPLRDGNGRPLSIITCHVRILDRLLAVLTDLKRDALTQHINTFDGCWCARHMNWKPGNPLSRHSWGVAVDVNARLFPYGSHQSQNPQLIGAFRRHGFEWGGSWRTPDPMHFEFVDLSPPIEDQDGVKIIVNDHLISAEGAIRGGQAVGPLGPIAEALGARLTLHPEQGKVYIYSGEQP